jgi:8-hydroxy-5-deazaflavin:NADPH oxidoreductase
LEAIQQSARSSAHWNLKEVGVKVGVLGSGGVAKTLASGFLKHGYEVMLGSRTPEKLKDWAAANPGGKTGTFADVSRFGELIVLAVKGSAAWEALRRAGESALAGKVVIDSCNPISDAPPTNGVLKFFTTLNESLMEQLQKQFPEARLVKAFNSVGAAFMVDPQFDGGKPTMFICGNDEDAKRIVAGILDQFGWETADMGAAAAARAIEPLCMLWCIPGFLRNEWNHAFKLLRK